jgi:hypothetical protein
MRLLKGKLLFFCDQGGASGAVFYDTFSGNSGYYATYSIDEGDKIRVYDRNDAVLFDVKVKWNKKEAAKLNYRMMVPKGVTAKVWREWVACEYKAELETNSSSWGEH